MAFQRALLIVLFATIGSASFAQGNAQDDAAAANVRQAIENLNWIKGPQTVQLFDVASIAVPVGYVFLKPEDTQKFMILNENPSSSATDYLLAPDDRHWFSVLSFSRTGYVSDDEKIDSEAAANILDSIRKGTEIANKERREKGWSEMTIVGWKFPPFYDAETKRLEWAINGVSDGAAVINFNSRILGRGGVTSAVLVADPEDLDTSVREFKTALRSYEYSIGQRYSEFRPGDKTAEYGLAALVAGGAAAIATKTGFWKMIAAALAASWKLVAAAFFGLIAYVRNLFKRKNA